MIQTKVFLKSFDTQTSSQQEKIDLQQELNRIKQEQEKIYQEKIQVTEKELEKRITQELKDKFNADLNNLKTELTQKTIANTTDLTDKLSEECNIYKENCLSVLKLFLEYYAPKLNKQAINDDIHIWITDLFKKNPDINIVLRANEAMLEPLKSTITMNSANLEFMADDTVSEGIVECTHSEGGGVYFSQDEIIQKMNALLETIK